MATLCASSAKRSSSEYSSHAVSATICCARTSSGASCTSTLSRSTAANRTQQRKRFHEVVSRHREHAPFRCARERVARSADPLQQRGDAMRRADLTDEIDVADIDAELERRGRDERFQLAAFQPRLGIEPLLFRQASMMRCHRLFAEPFAQMPRDAFGEPPRVHEHQRRPMRQDERGEPIVVLLPHLGGHHRFERGLRQFDLQIEGTPVPFVDDRAVRVLADQKACDGLRSDAASPTDRCARAAPARPAAAVRVRATGARRADCRSRRGSRPRSRFAPSPASGGCDRP